MKKILLILFGIFLAACGGQPPTDKALPFASLTPMIADAQPLFDLQSQVDGLNAEVNELETDIVNLESRVAQLEAQLAAYNNAQATDEAVTPTPTVVIWPTSAATSTPSNVITVVANRKVNLRTYTKKNNAGFPIMEIYEPRVQYAQGESFQIIKAPIKADGGIPYYQVVGPRGAGLYVRGSDINIPK